ncbi:HEAT repeat domain-containing protein [Streptomyces sp. NPDC093586]|uniref:HEAT repeat domain-containing protein n=1 Tax=Streptomyces sp. NPDC093586 TaxID=3366042 RepID=UPI0037FC5D66
MELIKELGDPRQFQDAREALMSQGRSVVPPLLREMLDESSPVDWFQIKLLIHAIGPAAYDDVLAALEAAHDEETRRRAGAAFSGLGAVDRYAEALSHPSATVRESAAFGIQSACSVMFDRTPAYQGDMAPVIEALVPLLADPDPHVAQRALWVLPMLGDAVLEPLRRIRRDGPGALRARVLTALASAGGEEALSERDRAAVARLIRIKALDDRAEPLEGCSASWIAVPGGDRTGITGALGLSGERLATFALGHSVVLHDSDDRPDHRRVYVTPEVDGWTLIVGPWCNPVDPERADGVLEAVTALSRRYGRAQAYHFGEHGGGSGWALAEHGTVVRRADASSCGGGQIPELGERLPEELALHAEWAEDDEDAEWEDTAPYMAPDLALRLGATNPFALGPRTAVRGRGVVALTPLAAEQGPPTTGAYRV